MKSTESHLAELRMKCGFPSVAMLCKVLRNGVSVPRIHNVECGAAFPGPQLIKNLAMAGLGTEKIVRTAALRDRLRFLSRSMALVSEHLAKLESRKQRAA